MPPAGGGTRGCPDGPAGHGARAAVTARARRPAGAAATAPRYVRTLLKASPPRHTGTVSTALILRLSCGADTVGGARKPGRRHARAGSRGRTADGRRDRHWPAAAGDGRRRLL